VNDEVLKRFGTETESIERITELCAMSLRILCIHGLSVTARDSDAPARTALRSDVEKVFRIHDTPSRRDSLHRTVELPQPITDDVVAEFARLFLPESST
jgi:hypothetical protein